MTPRLRPRARGSVSTAAKIGRRLKRPPVDGWTKSAVQPQKDIPPLAPTPEGTPHGATDPTGPRFWVGSEPVRLAQVKSKTGVARAWVLGETGRHWSPGSVRVSCGRPHARQGGHAERRHAERWGSLGPWARGALTAPQRKEKKRGREREGNSNCEVLAALASPTAVAASHVPDGAEP